ncbi:MAG: glycosyltransferase family 39 protein, partial [Longimicrobiales bacterium]|nr:glycosyltransferase family 39 protein [Longimicrobiales bacterium]
MSKPAKSVVLSLMLGGALRVYGLGAENLWLDEVSTVRRMGLTFRELFFDIGSGTQLPLYFWISKAWCALAGTGESALRCPALVFGLLIIPAVFFLGREVLDETVGAWSAFLVAINPYLIHYSQEARPYTLFALLAVVAWFFLVRSVHSHRRCDLAISLLATLGVLYTHPFGILILPTLLAAVLLFSPGGTGTFKSRDFRWFWRGLELIGLLYLPLLFRLGREMSLKLNGGSDGAWLPHPGWA